MADVNILVAIDADYFISTFGKASANGSSADNPVLLSTGTGDDNDPAHAADKYIRMLVSESTAGVTDEGGPELGFTAYTGDRIIWRERSLSADSDYSVVFYRFQNNPSNPAVLQVPVNAYRIQFEVPLPQQGALTDPPGNVEWMSNFTDFYWTTVPSQAGQGAYSWWCSIYERGTGSTDPVGFLRWDPFIKVLEGPR